MIMPAFGAIEATAFSTWLRESSSIFGFWLILSVHAIGMGMLIGASGLLALRFFGVATDLSVRLLRRLYPLIWIGFWLQVASGLLLLFAYPTKNLTNLDFYLKMGLIWGAMATLLRLKRVAFDDSTLNDVALVNRGRVLVVVALLLWMGALTAGRLLAYTATYLTYPG